MSRGRPSIASGSRRALLCALLVSCAGSLRGAPDFRRILSEDTLAQLTARGRLSHSFTDNGTLLLPPAGEAGAEAQRDMDAISPSAAAEVLVLRQSPSRTVLDSGAGELSLYNDMRSLSAMKGMTYWSNTKNQRTVLFRDSYAVDSPKRQKRLEDPLVGSIPERDELYIVQDDTTFGRNVYRATYEHRGGTLSLTIRNAEAISMFWIPVIRPGNLVVRFLVVPSGDSMLFWGACYVRMELPPLARGEIEQSVAHRLDAMVDWAVARLR